MNKPTIEIRCQGAITVELDKLVPLQGNLKTLSPENLQKLKASIISTRRDLPYFSVAA
jgi:hypothetical protein